jgi:hypothetical protein
MGLVAIDLHHGTHALVAADNARRCVSVCIRIHTHTSHTHTHTHAYIHTYVYIYVYMYMHTHTRRFVHSKNKAALEDIRAQGVSKGVPKMRTPSMVLTLSPSKRKSQLLCVFLCVFLCVWC